MEKMMISNALNNAHHFHKLLVNITDTWVIIATVVMYTEHIVRTTYTRWLKSYRLHA